MTRNASQSTVVAGSPATSTFIALLIALVAAIGGCQSTNQPSPILTEDYVDLERFAGDWYVIASIPTFIEKDAFDAIESYAVPENGRVETTFSFAKGGFDGTRKVYRPTGFVTDDGSNAIWGMQFVWPFKGDYRIVYLDDDYTQTVIGRQKRDYVWIMARTPEISDDDYDHIIAFVKSIGYDISKIQRVPQRW